MSTYLKYNATGTESNSLFKGNWAISRQLQAGFDIHVEVPYGGFTMINPGSPPIIRSVANEIEFVELIAKMGGPGYDQNYSNDGSIFTTVGACMRWLEARYPNMLILNKDYENIVTDGLEFMFDPNYLPCFSRYEGFGRDVSKNKLTANLGTASNIPENAGSQTRASVYDSYSAAWYNIKQACETAGFNNLSGILFNDQRVDFYGLPNAPFQGSAPYDQNDFTFTIELWISSPYGAINYYAGPGFMIEVGQNISNIHVDHNNGLAQHLKYVPYYENGVLNGTNNDGVYNIGSTATHTQPIHIVFSSSGLVWIDGQNLGAIPVMKGWVNSDATSKIRLGPQQPLRGGAILHNAKVYSRVLTNTEIQQNFDAQKGLYGKSGVTFT